jgi:hypothetical protein
MTAKPRVKCSECAGNTKKLIGAGAGIIFKGSGFYETDYKRKSGNNGAPPSSESPKTEADKEKSSEAKSDSKSETKSDSKKAAKAG